MKKTITQSFIIIAIMILGIQSAFAVQEPVDPNTRTSWPSPYPLGEIIISENFQDWPNTRTYSSSPLDCNMNNRETQFNWQYMKVHRSSGEGGSLANIYLISAEIQPFCDTQSGLIYSSGDTVINLNAGKCGPTNPGVSSGIITLYDSTYAYPKDSQGNNFRRGAIVIGQIPSISLIQYTTSSFGGKRGFTLEYSTDRGKTWTILRREHGKSIDSTLTTSGYMLAYSTRGIIWEEQVNLENAMLKFTINQNQPQLLRIHDIRVFGSSPLREDMDDSEWEASTGINFGNWMGINPVLKTKAEIVYSNGMLQVSGNPVWTKIMNIAGQNVRTFANEQRMSVSGLTKGVYLVESKDQSGLISTGKFCL